jgi:hypothetical protein
MAHAWWHPITTAAGNVISSVGQGLLTGAQNIGQSLTENAGQVAMGAGGLALINKAYDELGGIGTQALKGVDPIATAGLQQSAFRPFTVTTGTGSSFGAGIPAPGSFPQMTRKQDRIQQLMDSQGITREQAIANQQSVLMRGFDINNDGSVVATQEFAAARNAGLTGFPSTGLLTSGRCWEQQLQCRCCSPTRLRFFCCKRRNYTNTVW